MLVFWWLSPLILSFSRKRRRNAAAAGTAFPPSPPAGEGLG